MCTVLSLSEHRVVGLDVDQNKEIGGLIVWPLNINATCSMLCLVNSEVLVSVKV